MTRCNHNGVCDNPAGSSCTAIGCPGRKALDKRTTTVAQITTQPNRFGGNRQVPVSVSQEPWE